MKERYISTVEEIALRIADREDADRKLKDLRTARESFLWLQRAISERLMTRQEFYLLVPPNDGDAAAAALDYISAATAEALRCREESNEFRRFPVLAELSEDSTMHPLIRLVEDTGRAICKSGYDPKKLIDNLRSARYLSDLRWAWLRALQAKAIRWTDFVALVPPKDTRTPYVIRDYMLAFLYDTTDAAPAMLEAGPAEVIAP